jgi:hypothetical protein
MATVLAALMVASGCGGDSGGGGDPLTKAEFIRQGDAICKKGLREKNQAVERSLNELSAKERADNATLERLLVEVALPPVQNMAEEVGDLGAPKGDEGKVTAIVDALVAALEKAESNPGIALTDSEKIFGRPDELAGRYGLEACAKV